MNSTLQYWLELFSTFGWFLLLPIIERIWPIHRQPFFRWGLISDTIYTYQNFVLKWITLAAQPVVLEGIIAVWLAQQVFPVTGDGFLQGSLTQQSIGVNLIILVIVGEIAFYIVHYLFHHVPALWEFHRVHHSSVILDSLSTSRFHLLERIGFSAPPVIFMLYLGATPVAIVIYFLFRNFMDRYIHSNINGPRWTHKIMLSSPHFHRWHHATDPVAWNKNFSGDFIVLDILFGTAYDPDPKDKPPPKEFGDPNYSENFIVHQYMPFLCLYRRFVKPFLIHSQESKAKL